MHFEHVGADIGLVLAVTHRVVELRCDMSVSRVFGITVSTLLPKFFEPDANVVARENSLRRVN